jgi:hypothetical protein
VWGDAMNADLMITIAFCLYVLVGSLAVALLVAKNTRDNNAKEAMGEQPQWPAGPERDRK